MKLSLTLTLSGSTYEALACGLGQVSEQLLANHLSTKGQLAGDVRLDYQQLTFTWEPDNVEPDNVTPDNVTPDNVKVDNVAPGKVAVDKVGTNIVGGSRSSINWDTRKPSWMDSPQQVLEALASKGFHGWMRGCGWLLPANADPTWLPLDNVKTDNVKTDNVKTDNVKTENVGYELTGPIESLGIVLPRYPAPGTMGAWVLAQPSLSVLAEQLGTSAHNLREYARKLPCYPFDTRGLLAAWLLTYPPMGPENA